MAFVSFAVVTLVTLRPYIHGGSIHGVCVRVCDISDIRGCGFMTVIFVIFMFCDIYDIHYICDIHAYLWHLVFGVVTVVHSWL